MKIKARLAARSKGIPVVMDTSDRGMLDIERFDLEPERPIMHGMVSDDQAKNMEQWTPKERLALVMDMVGAEDISSRLKASLLEVEETLTTWPQLASSVVLGGALATVAVRAILLSKKCSSGRQYLDVEQLLGIGAAAKDEPFNLPVGPPELSFADCERLLDQRSEFGKGIDLDESTLMDLVGSACLAPTGGNVQPWKWIYKSGRLALFHDQAHSWSFLDFQDRGSFIGLGAAIENLNQRASSLNLRMEYQAWRENDIPFMVIARFSHGADQSQKPWEKLGDRLAVRLTNRARKGETRPIDQEIRQELSEMLTGTGFSLSWIEDLGEKQKMASIIAQIERQRILDPWGQHDFIQEARWDGAHAEATRTGVDLRTLELSEADKVGFKLIKDPAAIAALREWDMGQALVKMSLDNLQTSSAFMLLHTDRKDKLAEFEGGRIMERMWLYLNNRGVAYQPVSPATFMFARLNDGNSTTSEYLRDKLKALRGQYLELWGLKDSVNDLFISRLFYAEEPKVRSLRKPLSEVFKILY